jgi:hypothetical protein
MHPAQKFRISNYLISKHTIWTVLKIDCSFSTTNVFNHTIEGDSAINRAAQYNQGKERKSPSAHYCMSRVSTAPVLLARYRQVQSPTITPESESQKASN